jgi:hypothetical protein
MVDKKIDVITYAGHRGEEAPRAFILSGWKLEVVEIKRMWITEELEARIRRRFFDLLGDDGMEHTLYCDETTGEWYYRSRKQA